MKKINLLFTAILLLCCVGNAKAVEVTIDGIKYDVITNTKQAKVIRGGNYSGNIVIPSEITYNNVTCSVTSIGSEAFAHCDGLTSVTIGNSVTSIGSYAFQSCDGLTSVTIGNSVTSIGSYAFYYCDGLTSITIPNSVTSIGNNAFSQCFGLTSVTIGNSVTSIGNKAFYQCFGLTSVTIGNSVTSIGSYAFGDCDGLTSITIPNSVTSIEDYAFYYCTGLKTVYNFSNLIFNKGYTDYGYIAYYVNKVYNAPNGSIEGDYIFGKLNNVNTLLFYLGNETELTLPADYKGEKYVIKDYAFYGDKTIISITIPNSVTSIGERAFYSCSGLTSVTIGNSVKSIGSSAFSNCDGLKTVYNFSNLTFAKGYTDYGYIAYYVNKVYNAPNGSIEGDYIFGKPNNVNTLVGYLGSEVELTLPADYKGESYVIGASAFEDNNTIISITIPNSVTSIGKWAFYQCSGLTSVTIGNSVTSIGSGTFRNCPGLKSITIPNSVKSIGSSAFSNCDGLKSVTIGNSVTSIGYEAFYSCSGLTSITIPNSVTSIGNYTFKGCTGLTSVTIPNSVKSIGWSAFEGCTGLTSITIPNSVKSIESSAFSGCSGLTSITIPNSVKSIESSAFSGCSGLTSITIPNSVTSIGESAFEDCDGLTSITIPNSVTSIGEKAFYWCYGLKEVYNFSNLTFAKGSSDYGYIARYADKVYNDPNGSIEGDYIFCKLNNVNTLVGYLGSEAELTLPDDYKGESYVIGESAFEGNNTITSITIPNSVTSIGEAAFYGCNNLHSVTIGSGVLEIGNNAFNNPEKVIWLANTPPTGYTNAEGKINYVSNNQFTNLRNVYVYPYLSSKLEVDGIIYVLNPAERTCDAIDCAYNSTTEKINIGETISYRNIEMTVKTVMPYTCYGNSYIKEVEISNNGDIEKQAFYNCDNLQTVTVSNNGNIGEQAFYDCNNIKSVEITNVRNIESKAFEGCTNLPNIVIPNSVESIGAYSFKGCTALNNVTLGENVTTINDNTFENCSSLAEITIPATVTTIANNVFKGCSKLADVIIANSTNELSLGSNGSSPMFADCPLDSVYVGAKLRYNTSPFYNNKSLRTIVFADKETNIYEREFDGCSALENITLGNGITEIGNYAFIGCIALSNIVIPNSVTSLGAYSFKGCTTLNSVTFGENVTAINNNAFESCTNLPNIVIPYSVTTLGAYSFKGCSALNNITLGENVTTINDNTFENCSSLAEITIPATVTTIANNVFKGCSKLADVIIANSTNELSLGSNGSSPMFADCPLDSVYVGAKLRYNTSPFYNNKSLRTIVFGNKETNIYEREFAGCSALKNITLGNGITNIGNYAFENCSLLPEITIPAPVATVANNVFKGCSKLADVIIADRIKELSLGSNGSSPMFADCPLDSVYIGGEITYNTSSEYGYSPFYRNTSLRSVVISDLATKVYTNEFYGCTALTDVIIGHNVKNIGDYAFSGCSSLNAFTFGTSIEEIGKEALSDCVKLTSITSYATIPPTCGTQALEDINIFDCSLYVPSGYAQAYQQAEQWKNFLFVEELATTDNYVTYMIDDEVYKIILVKPGERIITPIVNERENYTFSGWNLDEYISVDGYPVMPDEDITISARYIANSYTVTYIVDGEVFATDSVAYGSEIVLIENPAKEGYTFSGWSEVPATMPAENITVEGTFTKDETGIDDITAESIKVVYDLNGNRILDTENLERGVYIINGKKTFVK